MPFNHAILQLPLFERDEIFHDQIQCLAGQNKEALLLFCPTLVHPFFFFRVTHTNKKGKKGSSEVLEKFTTLSTFCLSTVLFLGLWFYIQHSLILKIFNKALLNALSAGLRYIQVY